MTFLDIIVPGISPHVLPDENPIETEESIVIPDNTSEFARTDAKTFVIAGLLVLVIVVVVFSKIVLKKELRNAEKV